MQIPCQIQRGVNTMTNNSMFFTVKDVMAFMDVSKSQAYKIIRKLNAELEAKGFLVIAGRVSCKYFKERFYDLNT